MLEGSNSNQKQNRIINKTIYQNKESQESSKEKTHNEIKSTTEPRIVSEKELIGNNRRNPM